MSPSKELLELFGVHVGKRKVQLSDWEKAYAIAKDNNNLKDINTLESILYALTKDKKYY